MMLDALVTIALVAALLMLVRSLLVPVAGTSEHRGEVVVTTIEARCSLLSPCATSPWTDSPVEDSRW